MWPRTVPVMRPHSCAQHETHPRPERVLKRDEETHHPFETAAVHRRAERI